MKTFTYSPTPLFEGNKVRIAWDAEQEYDYNNQRISQYRRAIGIADGCEHVSSITNSVARKCQGTYDTGKLIVDSMAIGGHLAYGLGYSMTMAQLFSKLLIHLEQRCPFEEALGDIIVLAADL